MSIGEYSIDGFDGPQEQLCYIFFFLATFFSQIVALNLLIAIMGDTYAKVSEHTTQSSRNMKCEILSDYIDFC